MRDRRLNRTLSILSLAVVGIAATARADLSDVLGVTHVDGKYYFGAKDYLDEGADTVLATGSKVIKLEMNYSTPAKYPWNSTWGSVTSLTSMAQTGYFSSVFSKPFDKYVITAYTPTVPGGGDADQYWLKGVTAQQAANEQSSFYNLAKYLMQTYNGTGKTFVFEQWEGDWALRSGDPANPRNTQPSATNVQGMIDWINARQAGINQARAELGATSNVKVYQALELNRVIDAMNEAGGTFTWATVANDVLPHTNVDLASYSSYDTEYNTTGTHSFASAVNYIASKLPATAAFGQNLHSVGVGEFGVPEDTKGSASVNTVINNVVNTVTANGMPYAAYWEIYSNELKTGATAPVPTTTAGDAQVNGYWMIKPDGTPGAAWHQYRGRLITADATRATTSAVKSNLTKVYADGFGTDGTNLGTGWSTDNWGGAINIQQAGGKLTMNIANGTQTPWGEARLDLTQVLGRGLKPGEYAEFSLRRQNTTGSIGIGLYGSQHTGSGSAAGSSPLQIYSGGWKPISYAADGSNPSTSWDTTRTMGIRLDTADGAFATISYYLDGRYAGSWAYRTTATTLDQVALFSQSSMQNAGFEFDDLGVFARTLPGDADLSRTVDLTDFTLLATNFNGTGKTWHTGDFNLDGTVDLTDFTILATNFNKSLPADGAGASVVPEPSVIAALFGLLACAPMRRRAR